MTLRTLLILTLPLLASLALTGCVQGACDGAADCPTPLLCDRDRDACVECLADRHCASGDRCERGWCVADAPPIVACGGVAEPCCGGSACEAGLECLGGVCQAPATACGGANEPCCDGVSCSGSLECRSGRCVTASTCSRAINDLCTSDAECCDDPNSGATGYCAGSDGAFTCRSACRVNSDCVSGCCAARSDGVRVCSAPSACSPGLPSGAQLLGCGCWGYTDGRDVPDARCASGWAAIGFVCSGVCSAGGYPYAVFCR